MYLIPISLPLRLTQVQTELGRHLGIMQYLTLPMKVFVKTPKSGAQTSIMLGNCRHDKSLQLVHVQVNWKWQFFFLFQQL